MIFLSPVHTSWLALSITKRQISQHSLRGKLPDAVVACVGGGSNAVGMFYPFSNDLSVKLLGVEAGGDGVYLRAR